VLEPADRTRLLARVLLRFSPMALISVIVILATGLVQSYVEIRHFNLIFNTSFGEAAFIKLCLLVGLIGLGAINRQRTVPRLRALAADGATPGTAGVTLRNTLRAEVLTIVVVLGVAGALAGYAPAIAQYTGPFSTTTRIGPKLLQIDIDPARVGANTAHLYITDPKTGAQFSGVKELDVAETLPGKGIGPLKQVAQRAGPGHYIVPGMFMGSPGTWNVSLTMRVSAFDEFTKTLKVRVR
jgi:copper transport protein